jgi:hypothetical protein
MSLIRNSNILHSTRQSLPIIISVKKEKIPSGLAYAEKRKGKDSFQPLPFHIVCILRSTSVRTWDFYFEWMNDWLVKVPSLHSSLHTMRIHIAYTNLVSVYMEMEKRNGVWMHILYTLQIKDSRWRIPFCTQRDTESEEPRHRYYNKVLYIGNRALLF